MRLSNLEKQAIQRCQSKFFPGSTMYLFGSRTDDTQKGGDIDLYIETRLDGIADRRNGFLAELESLIGEQKIDLVVNNGTEDRPVFQVARNSGIRIPNEAEERVEQILLECEIHKQRLSYAASLMASFMPLDLSGYRNLEDRHIAAIDQFLYRFMKLQDAIGSKLFSAILLLLGEEVKERSAIDRLNRLEELGLLESRSEWEALRQIRNSLAHDYEEASETSIADLNRIYEKRQRLVAFYETIQGFYQERQKARHPSEPGK